MAKRKKSKGGQLELAAPSSGGGGHLSTSIDDAENGFIVNVSGESGGKENKYFSKRFISPTRDGALRIASTHLAGGSKSKGKKKSGGKKKISFSKKG
jgi:hypothetical protein